MPFAGEEGLRVDTYLAVRPGEPGLLGTGRRGRLPIKGPVHDLVHLPEPPARGEGRRVPTSARIVSGALTPEGEFQLCVNHIMPFSF